MRIHRIICAILVFPVHLHGHVHTALQEVAHHASVVGYVGIARTYALSCILDNAIFKRDVGNTVSSPIMVTAHDTDTAGKRFRIFGIYVAVSFNGVCTQNDVAYRNTAP